jgi:deazaflavin-dependent oxidoreductase (nitroreductase family)
LLAGQPGGGASVTERGPSGAEQNPTVVAGQAVRRVVRLDLPTSRARLASVGGLAAARSVSAGWRHSRSVSRLVLVGSTSPTEQQSSAGDERLCLDRDGRAHAWAGGGRGGRCAALERIKTRVEHEADKRFFVIGAWLYRRTNGRIVRLRHRRALILTASGRRSGLPRSVLLQFFPDGHDMVVVTANSGLPTHPEWYFNPKAHPHARVEVEGTSMQVRAEELSAEDAAAFWPRVLEIAPDYAKYPKRTDRVIPLIRLVPVDRTDEE